MLAINIIITRVLLKNERAPHSLFHKFSRCREGLKQIQLLSQDHKNIIHLNIFHMGNKGTQLSVSNMKVTDSINFEVLGVNVIMVSVLGECSQIIIIIIILIIININNNKHFYSTLSKSSKALHNKSSKTEERLGLC